MERHHLINLCWENYCKLKVLTAGKSWGISGISLLDKFLLPFRLTVFNVYIEGVVWLLAVKTGLVCTDDLTCDGTWHLQKRSDG